MTLSRLVAGLSRRGHQMNVLVPRRRDRQPAPDAPFRLHQLPGLPIPRYPDLRFGLPAAGRLKRLWRQQRPDLVHVATEGPLGWSALRAAKALGIPIITSFHTNFDAYGRHYGIGFLRPAILRWMRYCHDHARMTFVPSEDLRQRLETQGFRNLAILSRGVDTELFNPSRRDQALRASWGASPETPVAIYIGRLAGEKNLPLSIEAWQAMRETLPHLKFVLVGDGPERSRYEGSHPDLILAGMRHGEDLARHYASGDLFLFASTTETFGNVVTEAMASGTGVLAYSYAAPGRFIKDGVNGRLVPFNDREAYLRAARDCARLGPAAWQAWGSRGRETLLAHSWDSILDGFAAQLQTIVHPLWPGETR